MIDFEEHRTHLRSVALRMLGSSAEADDAVQEAWLRLNRTDATGIESARAWLTTVVSRICLDMLRSRTSRREDPIEARAEPTANIVDEAELAESVGVATLIVLEKLEPAERIAFVLHDLFGVAFDEIARIVDRTPTAARKLASRARQRVRGAAVDDIAITAQRTMVEAFLAALRSGDVEAIVAVLDPDVTVHVDAKTQIKGARNWAKGAVAWSQATRFVKPALVDGSVGLVLENAGRITRALYFTFVNNVIADVEVIAEPAEIAQLEIAWLPNWRLDV